MTNPFKTGLDPEEKASSYKLQFVFAAGVVSFVVAIGSAEMINPINYTGPFVVTCLFGALSAACVPLFMWLLRR